MKKILICIGLVLIPISVSAQPSIIGPGSAQPVRCVNAAGTAFESCAGGAGSGTTNDDDGTIPGGSLAVGTQVSLGYVWNGANWIRMIGDAANGVTVTCTNCGGSTFADNAAFTFGTSTISNVGFVRDDVVTNTATENSAAVARISGNRMQLFQLGDGAGNERRANVNASNQLEVAVGNTVTVTDGAGALNTIVDSGTITTVSTVTAVTAITNALPAGNNNVGDFDIASLPNEGQQTSANSISVVVASDQSTIPVSEDRSSTSSLTNVNDTNVSTTCLSANSGRRKVYMRNDSTVGAYVKYGTTASSTSHTYRLEPGQTSSETEWDGRIDCIWDSDASGAMRITELTN
jgi:hypothetical protein